MEMDWAKLDATTYSWQKVMGSEAQHGMLILSPKAVARIEEYDPDWPLPKLFRLKKGGKINTGIFEGATINTPSMLATEDYIDALEWAQSIGGRKAMFEPSQAREMAREYFGEWFQSSMRKFKLTQDAISQDFHKEAAFLMHQTAESLYHCVLLVCTFYTPHVHNLGFLRTQAERIDPRVISLDSK